MKRFSLALVSAASLALSGCAGLGAIGAVLTGSPASVANQSKLDEQVGLTVTLAYTAAARAAALAIETGLIKDRATIARIGQLNTRAYAAVLAVRDAYKASNSTSYLAALTLAREAIADMLAAVRGPVASLDVRSLQPHAYHAVWQVVRDMTDSATALLTADYRLAVINGSYRNA